MLVAPALFAPGAVVCQATAGESRLQAPAQEVRLVTSSTGGRDLVEVRVGEAGPYRFLVDTGSRVSLIDRGIASGLGLQATGTTTVGAPGGEPVEADVVAVPVLHVGELSARAVRMVALDLVGMTGGTIQGVLGMDLFEDVLLTLDPAHDLVIVSRGSLSAGDPDVIRFDPSSEGISVPMTVAGTPVIAHLDSGSPGGITLPGVLMDSLPLTGEAGRSGTAGMVGGDRSIVSRRLRGVVHVGALEFRDPQVTFMDPSPRFGNIGSQVIDGLVVTVDRRSGLVSLRRSEGAVPGASVAASSASRPPRRLGVRFGGPGGSLSAIAAVDPGSLGERAGFRAGDIVVRLNGRPMSDYDMSALGDLIRGTAVLTWEIDREGEPVTIVVR
jgi:hypothetical protein